MCSLRNPFLISIFILAMNIILGIKIEVEIDHIYGHIYVYICIHELSMAIKKNSGTVS